MVNNKRKEKKKHPKIDKGNTMNICSGIFMPFQSTLKIAMAKCAVATKMYIRVCEALAIIIIKVLLSYEPRSVHCSSSSSAHTN